jgi:PKD repeat protein
VKVKPEVNADFGMIDSIGCHPLLTTFLDSSWGHLDSTSYYWDFGDWTQSFEQNTTHTFDNFNLDDTTYNVRLVTESPFGCLDTMIRQVTVHPRVRAIMAVNTAASCSPLDITVNPSNSIGVDTFFWHVVSPDALGTGTIDTSYITTCNNPVSIYHYDSSYAGPDTIYIGLVGMNRMGCTDTFPERNVVVFPEVIARFSLSNDSICDADSILFTNESSGYDLFYDWDFDNGTILQDTTDADYWQQYYNRSDKDSSYRVTLNAMSGYFCESSFDTVIVVHPYISANFGMDYENNCTPILTTFTNLSIRPHFSIGTLAMIPPPLQWIRYLPTFWNNSSVNDTTYYVSLVVRNNEVCSDTIVRTIDIFPHVVAAFQQTDSIGCSPLSVSFINNSSGGTLSYIYGISGTVLKYES